MGPYPSSDPGDTGLWTVAELGQTRSLELQDTSVSDAGLRALAGLTLLETLYLDGTRVAGPGLAHLPGARLHTLSLARTAVDDAGLGGRPASANGTRIRPGPVHPIHDRDGPPETPIDLRTLLCG